MKDLDIKTKIKIFTLISFYELIIGFIIGIILNKFSKYIIPYYSSENIYFTIFTVYIKRKNMLHFLKK